VQPEGLCQRKIPMTPLGIKAATFQLVGQCLNQLRRVRQHAMYFYKNIFIADVIIKLMAGVNFIYIKNLHSVHHS
jgi:hypothetical protein